MNSPACEELADLAEGLSLGFGHEEPEEHGDGGAHGHEDEEHVRTDGALTMVRKHNRINMIIVLRLTLTSFHSKKVAFSLMNLDAFHL